MTAASNALQKAFDLFVFSSFYIALCATAMACQTAYLFHLHPNRFFYGFVCCGTVCSYSLHWGLTPKVFQNPMQPPSGLNAMPVRLHVFLAATTLVGAVVFFFFLRAHWFWLAGAAALSFLYTAPKIPLPVTRLLRKIAYGKTIFLALAWTYITAALPFLVTDSPLTASSILFFSNRFLLIYGICILFDLRDRESDKKDGIKSLITALPLHIVDRIFWCALVLFFCTVAALLFYFSLPVTFALLVPGCVLALGYGWFKKQQSEFVYNFLLDGLMVFSFPLLLLFSI